MSHPKTEVLSQLLDGELTPTQARKVEEHLVSCARCADLFQDLTEIQSRARKLPDQHPPRDLWPEISRALGPGGGREAEVIHLRPRAEADAQRRRMPALRISYLQAAAAALVVALFSGIAGAYFAGSGPDTPAVAPSAQSQWAALAGQANPELRGASKEIAQLEAVLAQHRSELDPMTVRLLEENLEIIDRAIRESLRALEGDPGNEFLERHLAQAVETKATYLREATAFLAPVS